MNLLTALLASFLAVAAANPVGDIAAREVALEARATLHCDLLPFLICEGGLDQEIACELPFQCPGNGLHPIISNATCAAQCVCEIPCP
ncbi:hypothetical protein B0H13DRAFT_2336941 [Mycena leptocephala]|nr:hypothetical protein B0H13DRAFT_2336941 [Mycena leptocephala]